MGLGTSGRKIIFRQPLSCPSKSLSILLNILLLPVTPSNPFLSWWGISCCLRRLVASLSRRYCHQYRTQLPVCRCQIFHRVSSCLITCTSRENCHDSCDHIGADVGMNSQVFRRSHSTPSPFPNEQSISRIEQKRILFERIVPPILHCFMSLRLQNTIPVLQLILG